MRRYRALRSVGFDIIAAAFIALLNRMAYGTATGHDCIVQFMHVTMEIEDRDTPGAHAMTEPMNDEQAVSVLARAINAGYVAHLDRAGRYTAIAWETEAAAALTHLQSRLRSASEPVLWKCEWDGEWTQFHDASDPMPEKWNDPPTKVTPYYAAPTRPDPPEVDEAIDVSIVCRILIGHQTICPDTGRFVVKPSAVRAALTAALKPAAGSGA